MGFHMVLQAFRVLQTYPFNARHGGFRRRFLERKGFISQHYIRNLTSAVYIF